MPAKLNGLEREGVRKAAMYRWTPLAGAALLYPISEGI